MNETTVETTVETAMETVVGTSANTGVFITMKAAVTALCMGFSVAFGWLGWLVLAWVICMALDWVTGSVAACKEGKWSSASAREGIFHKAGMMVVVITAAIADGVLGMVLVNMPDLSAEYTSALLPVVLAWYIFTELGSIAENANTMGAQLPSVLVKALAAGQAVTTLE